MITVNHAKYVELEESGKPPKALMWTDEYVEAWRENRRERNLVALDLDAARERRNHSMIARLEAQLDKLDEQERPSPVMVWTPEQTGEFLDGIQKDRLYPLYHLIAYRGTRRGEHAGPDGSTSTGQGPRSRSASSSSNSAGKSKQVNPRVTAATASSAWSMKPTTCWKPGAKLRSPSNSPTAPAGSDRAASSPGPTVQHCIPPR